MQEVFDKILEKLEELKKAEIERDDLCDEEGFGDGEEIYEDGKSQGRFEQAVRIIEIVKQTAAEYNNGWIPCSERLPEEYGDYLVAWRPLSMSDEDIMKKVGREVPHFYEIVEYDPDDEALWIGSIEQAKGEYEIIAWKPLPEPYQPKGEMNG